MLKEKQRQPFKEFYQTVLNTTRHGGYWRRGLVILSRSFKTNMASLISTCPFHFKKGHSVSQCRMVKRLSPSRTFQTNGTVPPESIYPLARGETSSLPRGYAANSPWCRGKLNLVLDEPDRTFQTNGTCRKGTLLLVLRKPRRLQS